MTGVQTCALPIYDLVTVTERDINEMILLMLEKHKLVVEAAGAVSLAALEHLNLRSRKFAAATGPHVVVPIMSGGNIDTVTMGAVIQKGMIARGRIMNFEVELPDTPGQLVKVATLLAEQRANVIQLDHDQFKASACRYIRLPKCQGLPLFAFVSV